MQDAAKGSYNIIRCRNKKVGNRNEANKTKHEQEEKRLRREELISGRKKTLQGYAT